MGLAAFNRARREAASAAKRREEELREEAENLATPLSIEDELEDYTAEELVYIAYENFEVDFGPVPEDEEAQERFKAELIDRIATMCEGDGDLLALPDDPQETE